MHHEHNGMASHGEWGDNPGQIINFSKEMMMAKRDLYGKTYCTLKDRIDALQLGTVTTVEIIEARKGYDGTKYKCLKERLNSEQKKNAEKLEGLNKKQKDIDTRLEELEKKYKETAKGLAEVRQRNVHVNDFGAVPDGKTDCTDAFMQAIGDGNVMVHMSEGTYLVKGIKLKSYTILQGMGKHRTILKLHHDTAADVCVITNEDMANGNQFMGVYDMTLDWNHTRQGGLEAAGGSRSSCLTFRNAKHVIIDRVEAINAGLHGIDITCGSLDYHYGGDGTWHSKPSQYVWIKDCEASNFGDDGITTHHSEYIFIENCYSHSPRHRGNQNSIEIDDGSRHIFLTNNHSEGCYGGIEIKAHETSSAPYDIVINGHRSMEDVRSYNFRHIGHHLADDPDSTTAKNIVATNLVSIYPNNKKGFQGGTSPKALAISAYSNVVINGFTAIGDKTSTAFTGENVIQLQYKMRNVVLNGVNISNFANAAHDIYVIGSSQRADNVCITNINSLDSAKICIAIGSLIQDIAINNVNARNNGGEAIIKTTNSNPQISNISGGGYRKQMIIAGTEYDTFLTLFNGGFRAASSSSGKISDTGAILGTTVGCEASGAKSFVAASSNAAAKGENSSVIASSGDSSAENSRNVVMGSNNSQSGDLGASSQNSSMVLASHGVKNNQSYKVVGGYGEESAPSTKGRKWVIDSLGGNIFATGTFTGSSSFSDYAEYFESASGEAIGSGTIVTLVGGKIKVASSGDFMLGAISETAGAALGEASFHWQDKYLKNEFGGLIYEERKVLLDKHTCETEWVRLPILNPNYDEEMDYQSREKRPEWNIVGLLGQMYVRVDESVHVGDTIVSNDNGVGTAGQSDWRVMKVTTAYNDEKGYGVALVFIR